MRYPGSRGESPLYLQQEGPPPVGRGASQRVLSQIDLGLAVKVPDRVSGPLMHNLAMNIY